MVGTGLMAGAFLSMLVFLVAVLQYELDLTLVVASLLAVSVTAMGLMLSIALESLFGLSVLQTMIGLGVLIFVMAGTYEVAS